MKYLAIAKDLNLPMDVVTQKNAFLGRTGSGKTYAATKLAELMLDAKAQIVVLDPVGVWYGLRLDETGKAPSGIEIPIFGGLHGDIPLESTGGALLADLVVDRALSVILDVSQFEQDTDKARFARDFAARFFFRKKASPSAVHLFIEECQEFIPQNVGKGEEHMLHAFHRMIKLGRNFGIGISLISQRPQEVNKKALNLTECMFAFQMTGPHERKAIGAWVNEKGLGSDVGEILPKLAIGEPHIWSPQWLRISREVKILPKRTFDASSTPTFGAKVIEAKPLGAIDLKDLEKKMASTIERAKETDPKALRAEVQRLERELAAKPQGGRSKTWEELSEQKSKLDDLVKTAVSRATARSTTNLRRALEAAMKFIVNVSTQDFDVAGVNNEELQKAIEAAISRATDIIERRLGQRAQSIDQMRLNAQRIAATLKAALEAEGEDVTVDVNVTKQQPYAVTPKPVRTPRPLREGSVEWNGELTGSKQRMLNAIAQLHLLAVSRPTVKQIAVFCGVSSTTGSFLQDVRDLAKGEYLERGKGDAWLTPKGEAAASVDAPDRDLRELWLAKLDGPQSKMLNTVLRHGSPISKDELADELSVSPSTGSFLQNLRDLRGYGVIEYSGGYASAGEMLK